MARREQFVNNADTTLSSSMTSGQTTASVADGSVFPSEGDFRIIVDDELMLVTARSTNTLTVERGIEGTTAATHSSGGEVTSVLTAGAIEKYAAENGRGGNSNPPYRITKLSDGSIATVSDFTWLNQGTATATDRDGRIVIQAPPNASNQIRGLYQAVPTPPYEIVLAFNFNTRRANYSQGGLSFRLTAGNVFSINRLSTDQIEVHKFSNETTFTSSQTGAIAWDFGRGPMWFKIGDDNTDLSFHTSCNGLDWVEVHSEARTGFTAPDHVGFFTNPSGANNSDIIMEILMK